MLRWEDRLADQSQSFLSLSLESAEEITQCGRDGMYIYNEYVYALKRDMALGKVAIAWLSFMLICCTRFIVLHNTLYKLLLGTIVHLFVLSK